MQSIKSAAKILNILNYFHLETRCSRRAVSNRYSTPFYVEILKPPMFRANYRGEAELISKHSSCRYNYFECQKVQKSNMYLSKQNKMKGILRISVT